MRRLTPLAAAIAVAVACALCPTAGAHTRPYHPPKTPTSEDVVLVNLEYHLEWAKRNLVHANSVVGVPPQFWRIQDMGVDSYARQDFFYHLRLKHEARRWIRQDRRAIRSYDAFVQEQAALAAAQAYERMMDAGTPPTDGSLIDVGRWIQHHGFRVSENPAFGGVCYTCHSYGSDHYRGCAIDVNSSTDEYARLTWLYGLLDGLPGETMLLWQTYDHYDHLHLSMC